MTKKKYLASITILVKDRKMHAADVNKILTEHGDMIISRLGMNVQRIGVKHHNGLITVIVDGSKKEIRQLTKSIDELYGIVAKESIVF